MPQTSIRTNSPNQRINLHRLHIIQLLQRRLDLPLIRLDIDHKHKRIILLDLLHRALRVQRVDDDLMGVETRLMRDRLARVFGGARERERLRPVEGGARAYFAHFLRVDLCRCNRGRQQCP